ncbi:MAG TPA: ADOP family duplicated permease [Gemmatimonadaceae bacterium]|nr:ADOP family duplicated permease [Gemmatimonadaceae bacterium]
MPGQGGRSSWQRYLRFFGLNVDAEVEDELRFHFDQRVADYLKRGLSREAAIVAARERLGDLDAIGSEIKAHDRSQMRRVEWRERASRLRDDVRVALRGLRRAPAFTIAASLVLAFGIGTSAAMFTVCKIVLIDRLPVSDEARLVVMNPLDTRGTHLDVPFDYLKVMARDSSVFGAVAGTYHRGALPTSFLDGSTVVGLATVLSSANYFAVLGMRPMIGRTFHAEDEEPGAPPVMVLSYAAWQRRFGGDSAAVGRTLLEPYSQHRALIIGVAPPGLNFPAGTDAWMPLADTSLQHLQVDIVARLAPHQTIATARDELLSLTRRVNPFLNSYPSRKLNPAQYAMPAVAAESFTDAVLGTSRPAVLILTLAVGLLLVAACVNVGSLILARLIGRTREVAVRRAIGGSFADVARLFAIENALLALLGGAAGAALAWGLLRAAAAFAPAQLPRRDAISTVAPPLAITLGVTIVALLLCGVAPSLAAARVSDYAGLRGGQRGTMEGRSTRRARRWLAASQLALALMLIAGAALLARSLAALQSMDLGYRPGRVSVLSFIGPQSVLGTSQATFEVGRTLVDRIRAAPGVVGATPIESLPFEGQSLFIMKVAATEQPVAERDRNPFVPFEYVGPDYFRTFDIPLRRGRAFRANDTRASGNVVVVNETLAHQLWPNQDAIGRKLVQLNDQSAWTVVGIASDTHFRELKETGPVAYFDWEQVEPFWNGMIAVRSGVPLTSVLPALRNATRGVNPALLLWKAQSMDDLLATPMAQPRLNTILLASFSLAALLLSAIGLYGVISAGVRHQTRDIGVRVALGAAPGDVLRLVLRDALGIVSAGAVAGIAGALIGSRLLASQLFGVSPLDPTAIAAAAALLVVVSLCAAFAPAWSAARIDPADALRME